jgi:SAM-dependent methyltransferase
LSLNYEFVAELIDRYAGPRARVLDYGCGAGQLVTTVLSRGHDAYGCDRYETVWSGWADVAAPNKRIARMNGGGVIPFCDGDFDIVVANQVFEHIDDFTKPLSEVHRVLKPRGIFINCFPTSELWWEGHIKAPLAHKFFAPPKRWHYYLLTMYRLGLGKDRQGRTAKEWASLYAYLPEVCFYRSFNQVLREFEGHFKLVATVEADWIKHRLAKSRSLAWVRVPKAADPLLHLICTRIAGRMFVMQRKD